MVAGIVAVATWLLQNTRGRLLLNAVLPRGPAADDPMRKAVLEVNSQLPSHVTRLAGQFGPARVQLVDCGGVYKDFDIIWTSLRAFLSSAPPCTRWVLCSTWCPC